jgi:hypothetical protein
MMRSQKGFAMLKRIVVLCVAFAPCVALATDIDGVQPAALDQPRINMLLRREPKGAALAVSAKELKDIPLSNIEAFLDTGASGVLLSPKTADALRVKRATVKGADGKESRIVFHDVGVGGSDQFNVSEPLYASIMKYHSMAGEADDESEYKLLTGPWRAQIGPLGGNFGLLDLVMSNLDVVGMPVLKGHVMVMDPKSVNKFDDTMRTYVYNPRTPFDPGNAHRDPGIPKTNRLVKLSYGSFGRFTHMDPPRAPGPSLEGNPFLGPEPTGADPNGAKVPPIVTRHNGKSFSCGWLLDTGAAASIISTRHAKAVGITYKPGTQGTDNPVLDGVPKDKQFTLTVGGIGGQKKSAGFWLDSITIPTAEGDPLVFRGAPVLVADITVNDAVKKQQLTLDGVIGMNFFVASAAVSEGLLPDIKNLTEGAFDWVVFDEPAGILGLQLRKELVK